MEGPIQKIAALLLLGQHWSRMLTVVVVGQRRVVEQGFRFIWLTKSEQHRAYIVTWDYARAARAAQRPTNDSQVVQKDDFTR